MKIKLKNKESWNKIFVVLPVRTLENTLVWVNLYIALPGVCGRAYHYNTEEDADFCASPGRINDKAFPIEIEE